MNYVKITKFDTANGKGIRTTLWVAGCEHHCPQCHNQQTWDFNAGQEFTINTMVEMYESVKPSYIKGITLSGGDPLNPKNRAEVFCFLNEFKAYFPNKDVWCYTGYTFEELLAQDASHILYLIDVLVDGRFIAEERDVALPFCGSKNQRVIDVKKSLKSGKVELFDLTNS